MRRRTVLHPPVQTRPLRRLPGEPAATPHRPAEALALLLLALALAGGCLGPPAPSPDAVARVAGDEVPYPEFETYLAQSLGEPGTALPSEVLSAMFDQFLDERLLVHLAADRGLIEEKDGGRRAAAALLAADAEAWRPAADEVAAHYRRHQADFSRPERVRLRQILVQDRSTAEEALAAVRRGADFAEVAEGLSREAEAVAGVDQGEMGRSDLPPDFADTIFALDPGEVSDVVPAAYGFHLFQVVERYPARDLALEEAAPEIEAQLSRQARERYLEERVREARNRYHPEVFPRNLPFNYLGRYGEARAEEGGAG